MYNDINTEERIDNYLLGRMSDEERKAFEADLGADAELREEYECQKEIANAVQRAAMREFLDQLAAKQKVIRIDDEEDRMLPAAEMAACEETQPAAAASRTISFETIFGSKRGLWAFVSIAAAVVIVLVGGFSYSGASRSMAKRGDYMFAEATTTPSRIRGYEEIFTSLNNAYNLISENELTAALDALETTKKMIDEERTSEIVTEEDEYDNKILQGQEDDLDWYKAVILMKQGKVFKARKSLKAIAASDSKHAGDAADALKKKI